MGYSNKPGEGERAIVNGHHDTQTFQQLVDKFIDTYVLCKGCRLPEIDIAVKKGMVVAACKACGWSGELDNIHKLASYIVKHPPSGEMGFRDEGQKSKADKRADKLAKQKKKDDDVGSDE